MRKKRLQKPYEKKYAKKRCGLVRSKKLALAVNGEDKMKILLLGLITMGASLSSEPHDPGITIEVDIIIDGSDIIVDSPDHVF
jgi:hypothetical protein